MSLYYNDNLVKKIIFNGVTIKKVNLNLKTIFEGKELYTPEMVLKIISPYGENINLTIEEPKEGGRYDIDNITIEGKVPVQNLVLTNNVLNISTTSGEKGLKSLINIPVVDCDDCLDYILPIEINTCTHPNLNSYVAVEPTCTTSGNYAYYKCSCSDNTLDNNGDLYNPNRDALGHSFTQRDTSSTYRKSSATCTSPAYYYYSCPRCGEKGTATFSYGSANGHSFTQDKIWSEDRQFRSAATCTSAATYWRECDHCTTQSTTQYFSSGDALGHDYTSTSTASSHLKSSATCTSAASYYYSCTRCGANSSSSFKSGSALGHSYNSSGICTTCSNKYPVTITSNPSSQTVSVGVLARFSVSASGYSLSYQWQVSKDSGSSWSSSTASSATSRTLAIEGATSRNKYKYRCKVTSANGLYAYSSAATLTVTS